MRLRSTESIRSGTPDVTFREALVTGLAPDGGLYLPIEWPRFTLDELESWRPLAFDQLASQLAQRFMGDEFGADELDRLVRQAFNFPVPLRPLEARHAVLELFHGPTLAFKDFGARFLARFLSRILAEQDRGAIVLVATSGDTGGAVAQGFAGVPNVKVVVVYPGGKVSPFQEAQMATLGGNITAVRLRGDFDQCQSLVKQAFLDETLRPLGLTSANSINVGRLIPQSFYYVAGYLALGVKPGAPAAFSVPSGNLGNVTAGLVARQMGLPMLRFIAATNANRVFPDYVASGRFEPRPSIRTSSSAMDVGNPSNISRVIAMFSSHADLQAHVCASVVDEAETRKTLVDTFRRTGYLLDPHGAVAYRAAQRYAETSHDGHPIISLATAHPAKFGRVIREELGFEPELPPAYRDWQSRTIRAVDLETPSYPAFRELLQAVAAGACA